MKRVEVSTDSMTKVQSKFKDTKEMVNKTETRENSESVDRKYQSKGTSREMIERAGVE